MNENPISLNLVEFPLNVLQHIFDFVPTKDLLTIQMVNSVLRHKIIDYHKYLIKRFPLLISVMKSLSKPDEKGYNQILAKDLANLIITEYIPILITLKTIKSNDLLPIESYQVGRQIHGITDSQKESINQAITTFFLDVLCCMSADIEIPQTFILDLISFHKGARHDWEPFKSEKYGMFRPNSKDVQMFNTDVVARYSRDLNTFKSIMEIISIPPSSCQAFHIIMGTVKEGAIEIFRYGLTMLKDYCGKILNCGGVGRVCSGCRGVGSVGGVGSVDKDKMNISFDIFCGTMSMLNISGLRGDEESISIYKELRRLTGIDSYTILIPVFLTEGEDEDDGE